jgi:hypothetical protein
LTSYDSWNGNAGWTRGAKAHDFVPCTPPNITKYEVSNDLEGPLVNATAKGYSLELTGMKQRQGRDYYDIRITLTQGKVDTATCP